MALSLCESVVDLHQKELLAHGDTSFPVACYEDDLRVIHVSWHWHEEWEFIYAEQGAVTVLLENAQVCIPEGDGLFLNAGALHAVERGQNAVLRSVVFHPRFIGGSADSLFWVQLVQPLCSDNASRYAVLTGKNPAHAQMLGDFRRAWLAIVEETEDFEITARYLLSKIWKALCRDCIQTGNGLSHQDRVDAERIRAMLTYIDQNIAGELSTKAIADSVCISESVCLRCFHRTLGITPIQYVKRSRLNKAAELLRATSLTTKAIALECGFPDVSYFTKAFRERMGCTPKVYREKP